MLLDVAVDLVHDHRREAERRLVDHQQLRLAHQASAEREHPALPARQRPGALGAALGERGEDRVDALERARRRPAPRVRRERAEQRGSPRPSCRGTAGRPAGCARARVPRSASGARRRCRSPSKTTRRPRPGQQAADRPQQRRLAVAVGADHDRRLAVADRQVDAVEDPRLPVRRDSDRTSSIRRPRIEVRGVRGRPLVGAPRARRPTAVRPAEVSGSVPR